MRANRLTRISYQERKKSRNLHPDLIQRPPDPQPTRPQPDPAPDPDPPRQQCFLSSYFFRLAVFCFGLLGECRLIFAEDDSSLLSFQ